MSEGDCKKYYFVINPAGGNGATGKRWARILPDVVRALDNHKVQELFTTGPRHAATLTREAITSGADIVVAVGGDGTLNEVLNGFFGDGGQLHGAGTASLGILQLGTACDFMRTLNWSGGIEEAIRRLASCDSAMMDVGLLEAAPAAGPHPAESACGSSYSVRRYFANCASLGASAEGTLIAPSLKWMPAQTAYVAAGAAGLLRWRAVDLEMRCDGGEWQFVPKTTMLAIGNGRWYGGGMKMFPEARLASGTLQMVCVSNLGILDFLMRGRKLYAGTHLDMAGVSHAQVQSVEVRCAAGTGGSGAAIAVPCEADGDNAGVCPVRVRVLPQAIRLWGVRPEELW